MAGMQVGNEPTHTVEYLYGATKTVHVTFINIRK